MNLELFKSAISNGGSQITKDPGSGAGLAIDPTVQLVQVGQGATLKEFINVPWLLHSGDPVWVPPLRLAVEQSLDTKKNPFYKHAEIALWVAYRAGQPVGRIAGVLDQAHNQFHEEKTAFWGFFECINDLGVAAKLFSQVESWARERGMDTLRGPINPSTNHECGLQINAFDTAPYIMMTQNPDYYPALVEALGHSKAKDLVAWYIHHEASIDERLLKFADRLQKRQGVTIRCLDMSRFEDEVEKILGVYNDAWEKNWGFVPMNPDEFRYMAKDMKPIVVPEMLYLAEYKGEVIAFSLFLPDLNLIMKKIPSGRLLPWGALKLFWYTKINKKLVNRGRILTLGVKQKYRSLGVAPAMYIRYMQDGPKYGFPQAECSWILEDNKAMSDGLRLLGAKPYKTYRIYDKLL